MYEEEIIDTWRTAVPASHIAFYTLSPVLVLSILSTLNINVLGTKVKQVISIPFLICLLVMPYRYRDFENSVFCIFCQVISFTMFQRFIDIFLIHPVIYKKDAYISASEFNAELLFSIRANNRHKPNDEKKVYLKSKKFYHLFPSIILNAIGYDIVVSWIKTFTSKDIFEMQKYHPIQTFLVCCSGIMLLTFTYNMFGKIMQLFYCILFDHGLYAPEEWRNMMETPIFGTSIEDVWSYRWHRILRPAWVSFAYKPVYFLVREGTNKKPKYRLLAISLASLSVFIASGFTHEYAALCNAGWKIYSERFMGQQIIFFGIQGLVIIMEKIIAILLKPYLPSSFVNSPLALLLRHIYVLSVANWTFPYFINSFAHWGFYKLGNFTPLEPILRHYLASTPFLRKYCGSNI
ncbi:uncharacterized protein BX663DRAFT_563802 [Cokeromyces recurvatus]|uniref:uncharacterized protein n=1 Tax=Cokeromyces recurvatus TaxID=90255 RepID=UPI0022201B2E|nr:uncharacterized protein BX663DRAFT_563802 [Cokeromyces recurvatus]KAI7899657.1 hypothetical protein BX663DRAFT_563802 [Cokeromyces recurvatus]